MVVNMKSFEVIQLITAIGNFDVDDIILNVLGAIIGYFVYRLIRYIVREKTKIEVVS